MRIIGLLSVMGTKYATPRALIRVGYFSALAFLFAWLATLFTMTLLLTRFGLDAIAACSAIVNSQQCITTGGCR